MKEAVSADTLKLTPHSTKTDMPYDLGPMEIDSDRQFGFTAIGVPPRIVARDQVVGHSTTVMEADIQRLPDAYVQYTWISQALTAVGALITAITLALFVRRKPAPRSAGRYRGARAKPGP